MKSDHQRLIEELANYIQKLEEKIAEVQNIRARGLYTTMNIEHEIIKARAYIRRSLREINHLKNQN